MKKIVNCLALIILGLACFESSAQTSPDILGTTPENIFEKGDGKYYSYTDYLVCITNIEDQYHERISVYKKRNKESSENGISSIGSDKPLFDTAGMFSNTGLVRYVGIYKGYLFVNTFTNVLNWNIKIFDVNSSSQVFNFTSQLIQPIAFENGKLSCNVAVNEKEEACKNAPKAPPLTRDQKIEGYFQIYYGTLVIDIDNKFNITYENVRQVNEWTD